MLILSVSWTVCLNKSIVLSVIMLNVIILNAITLSVIMLNVIMPSVVASTGGISYEKSLSIILQSE